MALERKCPRCGCPVRENPDSRHRDKIRCLDCGRVFREIDSVVRRSSVGAPDPARLVKSELTAFLADQRRVAAKNDRLRRRLTAPPRSVGKILATPFRILGLILVYAGTLGSIGCVIAIFFAPDPIVWAACMFGSMAAAGVGLVISAAFYGTEGDPLEAMAIWQDFQVESGQLPLGESRSRGGTTQYFRANNEFGAALRARRRARKMFDD